jgi:hypothetical protein
MSSRVIVVLPAPDGDDSTRRMPRRAISTAFRAAPLLKVLHLLAQLLDRGLERKTDAG